MSKLKQFIIRFKLFLGWYKPFKTIQLEDMPDEVEPHTLYLIGEGVDLWFATMKCPCGCKSIIRLSLLPNDSPRWSVKKHFNETVSLHPSVWRTVGCKSHFWFKGSVVHWCWGY